MSGVEGGGPWPKDVLEAIEQFPQGTLFEHPVFFYYGSPDHGLSWTPAAEDLPPEAAPTSPRSLDVLDLELEGEILGVVTSQSCDVDEEGIPAQPCFQAAPAYRLSHDPGRTPPQYLVPLEPPNLEPGDWVADLRIEVPLEKTFLVGRRPIPGFADEAGFLRFASALGRRRDRAVLAAHLVDAVAATLRKRKSNNSGFKKAFNTVQSVRLNITRGTRVDPAVARVHVVTRGPIDPKTKDRFDSWWDSARQDAESVGIELLPNEYHDGTAMDVELYEQLIDLGIR
jgi:hypothetical protein